MHALELADLMLSSLGVIFRKSLPNALSTGCGYFILF